MKALFLSICALQAVGHGFAQESFVATTHKAVLPRATPANTACQLASSAASSYLAVETDATNILIPAELAYDCLRSVPNYQDPAISLINSLRTYLEFQSSKEYLRNPPSGYLLPSVDIDTELDGIQKKVENGTYASEYDMQVDIVALLTSAHDGHLAWLGDLFYSFPFARLAAGDLVAISTDGIETPQIYLASDLVQTDPKTGDRGPVTGYHASPITSIDGVDVVSFALTQSLVQSAQDPDGIWNGVFGSPYSTVASTFKSPIFYPGPTTNITFANGTTLTFPNSALVVIDLDGIQTGSDAYSAFCPYAVTATETSTSSATTSTSVATSTQAPPSSPTIPGFPYPVIKDSAGSVAGYYLNDTGFTDTAILQIRGFEPAGGSDPADYQSEFQTVVQKFLDASVKTGKRKLIIDLQGNGGGNIDLGTDTFAQLFPSMAPNSKSNMRDHLGLWILGNAASANVSAFAATPDTSDEVLYEVAYTPMAYQSVVSPNFTNFPDFQTYYGPNFMYDGKWTSFFQNNYTDPNGSDFEGTGIIITGTNNRTGFRQPYAAQDIVVLYDGYCASTCTVLSEYLKAFANVQFIAIGGRPQTGPMQAIGGVKGVQIFPFSDFYNKWVDLFQDPSNHWLKEANGTIWENFTYEPYLRTFELQGGGVNGRNHFRINDETNTPLQFVYEAADCRMWFTWEMLYDPVFLWNRVATMAFRDRRGTQFNSQYCVANSTGHPTSISGGWKTGLGPQNPPANAQMSVAGWQLSGSPLQTPQTGGSVSSGSGSGTTNKQSGTGGSTTSGGTGAVVEHGAVTDDVDIDATALNSFKEGCSSYTGDAWFVKLMCNAVLGTK